MAEQYIIGIDQSTQGTKALLFDGDGALLCRTDLSHRQIIDENGWVSHDPEEIYRNTLGAVKNLLDAVDIDREKIAAVGISNQRETSVVWDRQTGKPVMDTIVWQCSRAEQICKREAILRAKESIQRKTGLQLSPYFPAAKFCWILEHANGAKALADCGKLAFGTIDTWLVYCLTGGQAYLTDYSNASRTQLYNIFEKKWDEEICALFGISPSELPAVQDSDGLFGYTDFEGILPHSIPIHGVLGDSHGALFGQGCLMPGMCKATYGTGSSLMMNIGDKPILSSHGLVTSLAWGMQGKVEYVLEGNINYTGAVVSWMKDMAGLISSAGETEGLCRQAQQDDKLYLVPAFTGLGAPYWDSEATAALFGMTRTTGRPEIVRAGIESIAYQIADVVFAMEKDMGQPMKELRTDGGPTRNRYLMQFQSDLLNIPVQAADVEELSGIGAAYAAGIGCGLYRADMLERLTRHAYHPEMPENVRLDKLAGWKKCVEKVMTK